MVRDYLAEFIGSGVGETFDSVMEVLKQVRREGTAVARGEVTPGVLGVAAPIFGGEPQSIGAVCLSNEERSTDDTRLSAIRAAVLTAAKEIDCALAAAGAAERIA